MTKFCIGIEKNLAVSPHSRISADLEKSSKVGRRKLAGDLGGRGWLCLWLWGFGPWGLAAGSDDVGRRRPAGCLGCRRPPSPNPVGRLFDDGEHGVRLPTLPKFDSAPAGPEERPPTLPKPAALFVRVGRWAARLPCPSARCAGARRRDRRVSSRTLPQAPTTSTRPCLAVEPERGRNPGRPRPCWDLPERRSSADET